MTTPMTNGPVLLFHDADPTVSTEFFMAQDVLHRRHLKAALAARPTLRSRMLARWRDRVGARRGERPAGTHT